MANVLQGARSFIIQWNNLFPLDRYYREKYKIPFGSSQHLEMHQMDILMEYLEDKAYEDKTTEALELITKQKRLEQDGDWIHENEVVTDEDFDKIVI